MKLNFVWKEKKGQFQTGQSLYLNKICVAGYSYNASRPQGTNNNDSWKGYVDLPGFREDRQLSDSETDMRKQLESVVKVWFTEALK